MNILLAGASGFIGKNLVDALTKDHTLTVLGRDKAKLQQHFSYPINGITWETLNNWNPNSFDLIINLCGENIAAKRWTPAVKKQLIDSRVTTTSQLIVWCQASQAKPHFICANAVGIYGSNSSPCPQTYDEESAIEVDKPLDFLSDLAVRWQQALQPGIDYGMKVTNPRFGVVLDKHEGLLKKIKTSYYLGLGAILGTGKQVISWVHRDDLIGALVFLVNNPQLTGVFNITSPNPVSQKVFAKTLASVLHRPLLMKMPAMVVKLLFGEMGEYLLLKGQSVVPNRLVGSGYNFVYPKLQEALANEFKK